MTIAQDHIQQRAIMRVYGAYRFALASALFVALMFGPAKSTLGTSAPQLFAGVASAYAIFALSLLLRHYLIKGHYTPTQLFFEFFYRHWRNHVHELLLR
jgi:hypothetical protein